MTKPVDAETEKVLLLFKGKAGHYVETKPLHGSQKSKWIDRATLEVTLDIIINYELERLILSYADSAVVLKPSRLASSIKTKMIEALNNY